MMFYLNETYQVCQIIVIYRCENVVLILQIHFTDTYI